MSDEMARLMEAPVAFGLRAQGHIPTVRRMLRAGCSWDEIGKAIGWDGSTAMEFYRHDREALAELSDRLLDGVTVALQAFTTEQLRAIADYRDEVSDDGWMQRVIREYIEAWRG